MASSRERVGEVALSALECGEVHGRGGELGLGGHDVEVRDGSSVDELAERRAVEEIEGRVAVGTQSEPRGGVRLGVEVDDQTPLAGLGQAGGEVDGRRGLADAALLIRDRVDPGRHRPTVATQPDAPRWRSGGRCQTPLRVKSERRRLCVNCSTGRNPPTHAGFGSSELGASGGSQVARAVPPGFMLWTNRPGIGAVFP